MPRAKPHISSLAKEFWKISGLKKNPPYDIISAISLTLPIDIVILSTLSLKRIENWLNEREIYPLFPVENRPVHGFILTHKGAGFIFLNGSDSLEERRFSAAHEASHFILDYKIPRDKAIQKLGSTIVEVLDGYREPSINERIDGVLNAISMEPFMHLLEKTGNVSFDRHKIFDVENDADALALELLAPSTLVIREAKSIKERARFKDFKDYCYQIITKRYGLPDSIANHYSSRLSYSVTGGPSIISKLGL